MNLTDTAFADTFGSPALRIDSRSAKYSRQGTVMTVRLSRNRYQNVAIRLANRPQGTMFECTSTVCMLRPEIDHRAMLELNQDLYYGKVVIHEGFLKVAAAVLHDYCTESLVRDMILEVARVADDLEMRIVGCDLY